MFQRADFISSITMGEMRERFCSCVSFGILRRVLGSGGSRELWFVKIFIREFLISIPISVGS